MYRFAMKQLYRWKESKYRKPLIIEGARQVGKTWLMREFGKEAYVDVVYINFDSNSRMAELFAPDLDIDRLILGLELYAGRKIEAAHTLLIFDEVQEVPRALASLKYFYENAPQYHIICAGSLLGIALHGGTSFPVGKVDFLKMYPLSFQEFLMAVGKERFARLLSQQDFSMITMFKQTFMDHLKYYYFVGGMPEVVLRFSENWDFNEARQLQQRILEAYEQDFSKHAPNEIVPRIRMLWNSIPSQLAKENKKFVYGLVREGARAKDYEMALMWLSDCGLIHQVHRVTAPNLPLKAYEDRKAFKLFVVDVGLLGCMTGLGQRTILDGNHIFTEFKGALTEQYVMQQLACSPGLRVYYYTNDRGSCEIDFVVDDGEQVIPVEVKAEVNLKAKSLTTYRDKYNPRLSVRTSVADYHIDDWLLNLPLYAIEELEEMIKDEDPVRKKSDIQLLAHHDHHIAREELERGIKLNRVYIMENDDQFAGWLRYNLFWDNTPFLNLLYVLEEYQGKGFGRQLVQFWEQEMTRQGYRTLMTSTQSNEYAQHFYFKLGYEAVGGFRLGTEPYEVIFAKSKDGAGR